MPGPIATGSRGSSGGGSDKSYLHTQGVAASSWVIVHNLGKYPAITVMDSARNEVNGSVVHDSVNQATVTFSFAFSGTASAN